MMIYRLFSYTIASFSGLKINISCVFRFFRYGILDLRKCKNQYQKIKSAIISYIRINSVPSFKIQNDFWALSLNRLNLQSKLIFW